MVQKTLYSFFPAGSVPTKKKSRRKRWQKLAFCVVFNGDTKKEDNLG